MNIVVVRNMRTGELVPFHYGYWGDVIIDVVLDSSYFDELVVTTNVSLDEVGDHVHLYEIVKRRGVN